MPGSNRSLRRTNCSGAAREEDIWTRSLNHNWDPACFIKALCFPVVLAEESIKPHVASAPPPPIAIHSSDARLPELFVDLKDATEKAAVPVLTILDGSHE